MADNKKLRQKTSDAKKANDLQKELLGNQQKELQRQSNLQEIQAKIQESSFTAQKLRDVGDVKNAKLIEDSLNSVQELLGKNKNSNSVAARLEELVEIQKSANAAAAINAGAFKEQADALENKNKELEQKKKAAEKAEQAALEKKQQDDENFEKLKEDLRKQEETLGLQGLTDKIKSDQETEKAKGTLGTNDLGKRLSALSLGSKTKDDKERTESLKSAFTEAQSNLKKALASGDEEQIKLARKQVENLENSVKTEENFREERIKADKSQSTLLRISEGIQGFNDKLKDMAKGGGFVAGLAAIVLAVFNPEALSAIVMKVVNWFSTIVDALEALINGDMEKFKTTILDNFGLFAGLLGLGLVYFGPALLSGLFTVMNTMKAFRAFMLVTAFPAISAFFTGMMTTISAALVPMLPIIGIGAAVVAILGVLLFAFHKLRESLGPGAGIMDTLKVAMLYFVDFLSMIVNGITFIPRKMISFLGKRAAGWILGDDFDTSALDAIGEGLDTGRGRRAAEEIRAKNEAAAAEEALEKERQSKIGTGEGFDMSDLTSENADIMADLQAQGFNLPSAVQTNVQNSSSTSQSTTIVTDRPSRASSIIMHYNSGEFR